MKSLYLFVLLLARCFAGDVNFKANPVSIENVQLQPGSRFATMQERNIEYLVNLDNSRLTCLYMSAANLSGTFVNPTCNAYAHPQYWGHYLGHWLSATALGYAATRSEPLRAKMTSVVQDMASAQAAWTAVGYPGYLFPYDPVAFDNLENLHNCEPVCVPYYVMHKMMAGLLEQYTHAGNEQALNITVAMAGWVKNRVESVLARGGESLWQQILGTEWGGMNEALFNLYGITGNPDHLTTAYYFNHYVWSAPLAIGQDDLSGNHANTHIPEVIGDSRGYELTGNQTQYNIAHNFFEIVTQHHSFSTGGSSDHEYWGDANRMGDQMDAQTEESCTTYNILKLARNLYRWTANSSYFDFYERAIYNGLLGNQNPLSPYDEQSNSTGFIYMLPLGGGGITKAWGASNDGFPCCWGTLSETFSKLSDSIYAESPAGDEFFVNLYASSTVYWAAHNVTISQSAGFPESLESTTRITIDAVDLGNATFTLSVRIPYWATNDVVITLNNATVEDAVPGTYLSITRTWSEGDELDMYFEPSLRFEHINDDRQDWQGVGTFMYGAILLAGITPTDRLPGDVNNIDSWIMRNSTTELTFVAQSPCGVVDFIPLNQIMFEAYAVYFHTIVDNNVTYNSSGITVLPANVNSFAVQGGAGIVANGNDMNIRSGDPDESTAAMLEYVVSDPYHAIIGASFTFQYVTGYASGQGSTISFVTQKACGSNTTELWRSKELTDYPYDQCNNCYSPPVTVNLDTLYIDVTEGTSFGFAFQNNDRNLQILLPVNVTIYWDIN